MNVSLKCNCGAMRGVAQDISSSNGVRLVCMCDDCQAYAHFLGKASVVLDEHGGSDIFQMYPSHLKIVQGGEHLKCMRLTEKGMCRWYASCCNTPIANSTHLPKVPFAGVLHTIMDHAGDKVTRDQALGPVRVKILGKYAIGKLPSDAHKEMPFSLLPRLMPFLIAGWVTKKYTPSPFFDAATGKPVVEPYVLAKEERERLRKLCGPNLEKQAID